MVGSILNKLKEKNFTVITVDEKIRSYNQNNVYKYLKKQ